MFAKKYIDSNLQQLFLLILLLLLICILTVNSEFFLTWRNWRNIIDHISTQMLLAIGMTFVIATSGLDLSIGGMIALCSVVMGMAMNMGLSVDITIFLAIVFALCLGFLNGLIISSVCINPFIITLGTASVFRGIAIILTGGTPIYSIPMEFTFLSKSIVAGITPSIFLSIVVCLWAVFALNYTSWGLYTMSIGSNPTALQRQGVRIHLYKISVYMLSAIMACLSAIIITARLSTAEPTAGTGMELDAITAVIMGGTLMQGGKASISGTVIACLLLAVIKNALTILSVNSYYQQFIIGVLLLVSVIVTEQRKKSTKKGV